jgi:hypothetical protein
LSHYLLKSLVLLGSESCKFLHIETSGSKTLVKCLCIENVDCGGYEVLEDREENGHETAGEERGPVVKGGIDPSEEEVVVAIWEALSLKEEFLGSCLIEEGACFGAQGHVGYVEVSVLGPLDPVGPLVALDSMVGPVPAILRLDEPQFTVKSKCHH